MGSFTMTEAASTLPRLLMLDDETPLAATLALLFEKDHADVADASIYASEALMRRDVSPFIVANVRVRPEVGGPHLLVSSS